MIKPLNEGSSVNVFICTHKDIFKKLRLLENYRRIMIEEFIPGREIQAAIIGQKTGAIELKPKENFMIIKLSITLSNAKHIIPVDLQKDYYELMRIALKAHNLIDVVSHQIDFKFFKGKFYLLKLILNQK